MTSQHFLPRRQSNTTGNFISQDGWFGLSFANNESALMPRDCSCGDNPSDNIKIIPPRMSPVFRTLSAERGDARANRLTTGVPITGVAGPMFTLNPTDFVGVRIMVVVEFSFPTASDLAVATEEDSGRADRESIFEELAG